VRRSLVLSPTRIGERGWYDVPARLQGLPFRLRQTSCVTPDDRIIADQRMTLDQRSIARRPSNSLTY
jgi:hypothetical protein